MNKQKNKKKKEVNQTARHPRSDGSWPTSRGRWTLGPGRAGVGPGSRVARPSARAGFPFDVSTSSILPWPGSLGPPLFSCVPSGPRLAALLSRLTLPASSSSPLGSPHFRARGKGERGLGGSRTPGTCAAPGRAPPRLRPQAPAQRWRPRAVSPASPFRPAAAGELSRQLYLCCSRIQPNVLAPHGNLIRGRGGGRGAGPVGRGAPTRQGGFLRPAPPLLPMGQEIAARASPDRGGRPTAEGEGDCCPVPVAWFSPSERHRGHARGRALRCRGAPRGAGEAQGGLAQARTRTCWPPPGFQRVPRTLAQRRQHPPGREPAAEPTVPASPLQRFPGPGSGRRRASN